MLQEVANIYKELTDWYKVRTHPLAIPATLLSNGAYHNGGKGGCIEKSMDSMGQGKCSKDSLAEVPN